MGPVLIFLVPIYSPFRKLTPLFYVVRIIVIPHFRTVTTNKGLWP
jgi:hypothetical protein